ncbi:MAG: OmpH family outer membrane protein [Sinimarinibacterium flocculans]|uniref:Periplasmic chaperone for outer membrane proteins Skp n=1 Tax=Sinimarinibacterium flocculans TaxID=985250 RepID=A0A318EI96_9GAMM|nr:OmpH family outer membrane protein [Sinimarinibacterium flocculans]MEC9363453.1 OmpH family outer membrane protein [Pseudomonadota bacterium]PXV68444.1 periplasmic chaperone for outer membrane proteins Skp [Sinimarinibacterium flocculans]
MTMFKTVFAAAAVAASVFAATPALAQTLKIASIRSNELLQQSPQFKASQEKMKQEFERRANDLEAEAKALGEDIKTFQREAELLSSADRARKEKDLNTRKIDFEYKTRQFQEERQTRERQLFAEMMGKIKGIIEVVAKEEGVTMVIENPVYAADDFDITDKVLKRLQSAN